MSDNVRHQLFAVAEAVRGETPVSPALSTVRHTSCSLALAKETFRSEEIDPTRNLKDFRHGNQQIGGDIGIELSAGSHDQFLEALLGGSWSVPALATTAGDIAATSGGSTNNGMGVFTSVSGEFPTLAGGGLISVSGFVNPENNGVFLVRDNGGAHDEIWVSVPLIDESIGPVVTIAPMSALQIGQIRRQFSMIRHFTDQLAADEPFHRFTGVELNKLALKVTAGKIVTGTFGVLGRTVLYEGTAPVGATYPPVTESRPIDGFTGYLTLDGAPDATITEISLNIENGLTPNFVLFDDKSILPSIDVCMISGEIACIFKNSFWLKKFLAQQYTNILFTLQDQAGAAYTFELPYVSLGGGQPDVSGTGIIPLKIPFTAVYDKASGSTITISRGAAAV